VKKGEKGNGETLGLNTKKNKGKWRTKREEKKILQPTEDSHHRKDKKDPSSSPAKGKSLTDKKKKIQGKEGKRPHHNDI